MLFAAPINTDAPIYHWPRATLGLIVGQIVLFVLVVEGAFGPTRDVFQQYALVYGDGLHPVQWVTSNFLHGSLGHLLGNCFFLWGLGLVVEGKLGWLRFLVVFFGIGIVECAIEQACLQGIEGMSFGSSSILFGLLAMALLWAPKNEITFGYLSAIPMLFGAGTFDMPIQWFAILAFAQEVLMAWLHGFQPQSELLHLAGAMIGAGVGWTMLKRGTVDCEGWDLLSLMRGDQPGVVVDSSKKTSSEGAPGKPARKKKTATDLKQAAASREARGLKRIRLALDEGRTLDAFREFQDLRHKLPEWSPPEADLRNLAEALHSQGNWEDAAALMSEYARRYPENAIGIRLTGAALLIEHLSRPQAALKLLQPIPRSTLTPKESAEFERIQRKAYEMVDAGVVEFDRSN